ncbi:Leucine rich repeat containing protein BspA family protein [Entamoeba marina]
MNTTQLDSYSMLIVSKYFITERDYINLICVCKKFKETTEKLRYNPIPITSLKLFPKMQTQYLYDESDTKIEGIDKYEIWYNVDYDQYLKFNEDNIKCRQITFTYKNVSKYGNEIPVGVNILGDSCYEWGDLESITIPTTITLIEKNCFNCCADLERVILPSTLKHISTFCFYQCFSLTSITIPSSVTSIGVESFGYCLLLEKIEIPDSVQIINSSCFDCCAKLQSIKLSTTLIELQNNVFEECGRLSSIELPKSLTSIGNFCFKNCISLNKVIGIDNVIIGKNCFDGCYLLNFNTK